MRIVFVPKDHLDEAPHIDLQEQKR